MNQPIFLIKKFEEPSLGSYLRNGREKLKLSLGKLADQTSISVAYLRALEKNDFSGLPPEIYTRGFISRYCDLVDLDSGKALYLFERSKLIPKKDKPIRSTITHARLRKMFSYRNVIIFIVFISVMTSVSYLFKVIYPMYAQPSFKLLSPNSCPFQTYQEKIDLEGVIQPEGKIWINNEETLVGKEGNFRCPVFLKEGANTVQFRIINKFGKERVEECVIREN